MTDREVLELADAAAFEAWLAEHHDSRPEAWLRIGKKHAPVELIAIADALPPAAAKLLDRPVPLSSMTWLLNILTPHPATTDGWWLLQAEADHARDGNSSQTMRIWNADGRPIAEQMQSVAIFA